MTDYKNKVILIGGDHHNGLGLARSFGVNGIKPYGVIVTDGNKKSFISKSRYWEKTWIVDNEKSAIKLLMQMFANEVVPPVIIPWSDSAAAEIDRNYDKLKNSFIVPSLHQREGAIIEMMDKKNQIDFLRKFNLPMAESFTVDLPFEGDLEKLPCPSICKPVSSYEGNKIDIKKCDNRDSLSEYLSILFSKGYKQILIQEYIHYDKELEFVGACCSDPAYIISDNVREWPVIGGTNSFLHIIDDKAVHLVCKKLLTALQEENYYGLFDIELFQVGNRILINEINWRNTGNSFFALGTGVHYAVIWYLNAIGANSSDIKHYTLDTKQYAMNEATDLRHVVFKGLSFDLWFKDLRRTKSFALWYSRDLIPTIVRYCYLIKELVLHRHNG